MSGGLSAPDSAEKLDQAFDVKFDQDFEVKFETLEDPEDPLRLSEAHRWFIVVIVSITSVLITSIASAWALVSDFVVEEFHVSHEVSTLGISFYIWFMGVGGMFLSPISEFHGRKIVLMVGLVIVLAFQFVPAFSDNIGAILFSRVISGFFAASFMTVVSGTFSDLFRKTKRTEHFKKDQDKELHKAVVLYSVAPFIGPGMGPLIAGFVCQHIHWRWVFHIMCIWTGVMTILVLVFVPETYEPILLKKKAARLRKETGDSRYYAPLEVTDASLFHSIVLSSKRPFLLIYKDLMTSALCLYAGFILATIYLFFIALPYTMNTVFDFNLQDQGLSFLGLTAGLALAAAASPKPVNMWHESLMRRNGGVHKPEYRFLPMMVGVFIAPIGLFIMAWTAYPHLHWIGPIIGAFFYGVGTILIFNGMFAYIVEAYRKYTASAMATNSFVRSLMSGIFPLFGLQMYQKMGIHWASTLLGLFACVFIPIPFLLFKYGPGLRARSPYTWAEDE